METLTEQPAKMNLLLFDRDRSVRGLARRLNREEDHIRFVYHLIEADAASRPGGLAYNLSCLLQRAVLKLEAKEYEAAR